MSASSSAYTVIAIIATRPLVISAARMLCERTVQLVLTGAQPLLVPTLVQHAVVPDDAATSSSVEMV